MFRASNRTGISRSRAFGSRFNAAKPYTRFGGTAQDPIDLEQGDAPRPVAERTAIVIEDDDTGSSVTLADSLECQSLDDDDDIIEVDELEIMDERGPISRNQQERVYTPKNVKKAFKNELRNPPIVLPRVTCSNIRHAGLEIRPGKTVELLEGEFLRIKDIIRNTLDGKTILRGHRLQRVRDLNGLLDKKANELVLCLEIDLDDPRQAADQACIEVPVEKVAKIRIIRPTNQKFPLCRGADPSQFRNQEELCQEGCLTLRWKYTCFYASADKRHENKYKERVLERLRQDEAHPAFSVPECDRRREWRGNTIPGGAYKPIEAQLPRFDESARSANFTQHQNHHQRQHSNPIKIDVEESSHTALALRGTLAEKRKRRNGAGQFVLENSHKRLRQNSLTSRQVIRLPGQKLTYGDAFMGCGGTTRGAYAAGLHVLWGFDFNPHACSSFKANFPRAKCHNLAAHEFVSLPEATQGRMKVDILHLSPPCQFFSPAHTREGLDDEMNTASLFAVQSVINVSRPRVVTLEQTFGLENQAKSKLYFNSLIQMFTTLDFSVRWAIVPLAQWGLPQRRTRLIIIASCPGGILPKMPPPTHRDPSKPITAQNRHLKQYVTVADALSHLPRNLSDNTPQPWPKEKHLRPWDANHILPRAMTCSGGQNYHPSGTRNFTLAEYAALQGFPANHLFRGNAIKKQIGNAVPPVVAKVLFESIRRELDEADGVQDEVIHVF